MASWPGKCFSHHWSFERGTTEHHWIPLKKDSNGEIWRALCCYPEQAIERAVEFSVSWDAEFSWIGTVGRSYEAIHWNLNIFILIKFGVSNHRRLEYLLERLFGRIWKRTSKLRVIGLCEGNPPVTGGSTSQRASNAKEVSIWWRHHISLKWCHFRFSVVVYFQVGTTQPHNSHCGTDRSRKAKLRRVQDPDYMCTSPTMGMGPNLEWLLICVS